MTYTWPPNVLLGGVVGSTAYGLAREGSDKDRLGIFRAGWLDLSGLNPPQGRQGTSFVRKDPDVTLHEALKFCHLALGCNPTVLELMWLPNYESWTWRGRQLVDIRTAFLSQLAVRRAYLGYATQQFQLLRSRGGADFGSDLRKRTEKHARHLLRLLRQGVELHNTGQLTLEVQDPQEYFEFGERVGHGDISLAEQKLRWAEGRMDLHAVRSPLGDEPDREKVESWLRDVRYDVVPRPTTTA
jgi:predicted nucleotidyltransferase